MLAITGLWAISVTAMFTVEQVAFASGASPWSFALLSLFLATALLACGQLVWRLLGRHAALCAALVLCALASVVHAALPSPPMAALLLAAGSAIALWSTAWRDAVRGAAVAGAATGLTLWAGPAALPGAVAVLAIYVMRWRLTHRSGVELTACAAGAAFAAGLLLVAAMFALPMPAQANAPFLGGAMAALFALAVLGRQRRLAPPALAASLGLVAASGIGVAVALGTAIGAPLLSSASTSWTLPGSWHTMLLAVSLAGSGTAMLISSRSHAWLREWWAGAALLGAAATLAGAFWPQAALAGATVASVPLGAVLAGWLNRAASGTQLRRRAMGSAALILALSPAIARALA